MTVRTDTDVLHEIAVLVGEQQERVAPDVSPGTALEEDLGMNSAQVVDLLGLVEERFDCVVEDEDLETLETVGDLVAVVARRADR